MQLFISLRLFHVADTPLAMEDEQLRAALFEQQNALNAARGASFPRSRNRNLAHQSHCRDSYETITGRLLTRGRSCSHPGRSKTQFISEFILFFRVNHVSPPGDKRKSTDIVAVYL